MPLTEAQTQAVQLAEMLNDIKVLWSEGNVTVKSEGPTAGGYYFIDIWRKNQFAVVEVRFNHVPKFGFSVIDEESGYGDGADCLFDHWPTLLKYLKRLLP